MSALILALITYAVAFAFKKIYIKMAYDSILNDKREMENTCH